MALEPGAKPAKRRMLQPAIKLAAHPRQVSEIAMLPVAQRQSGKDPQDLGGPLRTEDRIGGPESRLVEPRGGLRTLRAIEVEKLGSRVLGYIDPRILED